MLAISVKLDEASIAEAKQILRGLPRAWPRIAMRGINRTVDSAATDLKRRTAEQITLKKSEIAKGITKRKATLGDLYGNISTNPYRPGIFDFPRPNPKEPGRRPKRGFSYRISRKEGRKRLPHGFVADMPRTGHRGAFVRKGRSRLPIVERFGPSIWRVITDAPGLLEAAQEKAGSQLGKNISDQVGVELRRWRKN